MKCHPAEIWILDASCVSIWRHNAFYSLLQFFSPPLTIFDREMEQGAIIYQIKQSRAWVRPKTFSFLLLSSPPSQPLLSYCVEEECSEGKEGAKGSGGHLLLHHKKWTSAIDEVALS